MKFDKLIFVGAGAIAVGIGGWLIKKLIEHYFSGKTVAFIGMKGAGKTTACDSLSAIAKGDKNWKARSDEYKTTETIEEYHPNDESFHFKKILDTPGAQQLKAGVWDKIKNEVDLIFYLYDISKLEALTPYGPGDDNGFKTGYYKLVKADLRDIAQSKELKSKKIIVIATHTDKEYDKDNADRHCADILSEFSNCNCDYKFVDGSLMDYESAKKLWIAIAGKLI